MKAQSTARNEAPPAVPAQERRRLRNRLLKHILDNQRRRETLRRDAAAAVPTPHLKLTPPVAAGTQEAG